MVVFPMGSVPALDNPLTDIGFYTLCKQNWLSDHPYSRKATHFTVSTLSVARGAQKTQGHVVICFIDQGNDLCFLTNTDVVPLSFLK